MVESVGSLAGGSLVFFLYHPRAALWVALLVVPLLTMTLVRVVRRRREQQRFDRLVGGGC